MAKTLVISLTALWVVGCAGSPSARVASSDAVVSKGTGQEGALTSATVASTNAVDFIAKVTAIEYLGHRTLRVILVGPDPRFALIVEIRSASPPSREFEPGREVVFAIHSPSMLFGRIGLVPTSDYRDVIGRQFEFAFDRDGGRAHLQAVRRLE